MTMTDSQQHSHEGPAPDFRLHCKRCGNAFVEMKDLLFHPCQQPARPKPKRARKGKKKVVR